MTDPDGAADEPLPLTWACLQPGVRAAAETALDILVTVRATAIVGERPEGVAYARAARLQDASLSIRAPAEIHVQALTSLEGGAGVWRLPDMGWPDVLNLAFRMTVPPRCDENLGLMADLAKLRLRVTVRLADGAENYMAVAGTSIQMPVLADAEWHEQASDAGLALAFQRACAQPAQRASG